MTQYKYTKSKYEESFGMKLKFRGFLININDFVSSSNIKSLRGNLQPNILEKNNCSLDIFLYFHL